MNVERPHDIRRFHDGEEIPHGYVELTQHEFELLGPMSIEERAAWLEEHGELTSTEKVRRSLLAGGVVEEKRDPGEVYRREDLEEALARRRESRAMRDRGPMPAAPPITPRQHRSQGR